MKWKWGCSPGRGCKHGFIYWGGKWPSRSPWSGDAISRYNLGQGRLRAQAAVSPPALSLCVAHPCPIFQWDIAGAAFWLFFFKIRIPSLSFCQTQWLIQLIKHCCDGMNWCGGGEREGGRWWGRRAAPPPLAPASHFYGCNETVPFPKRAPRLLLYHTHAQMTPKLAEQRRHGMVHSYWCASKPAFRVVESPGFMQGIKYPEKGKYPQVCLCVQTQEFLNATSISGYTWLWVGHGPGAADTKAGDRGRWLRLSAVLPQPLLSRVGSTCLGCTGQQQRAQTCPVSPCTFLWSSGSLCLLQSLIKAKTDIRSQPSLEFKGTGHKDFDARRAVALPHPQSHEYFIWY